MAGLEFLLKTSVIVTAVTVLGWGIMKSLTPTPEQFKQVRGAVCTPVRMRAVDPIITGAAGEGEGRAVGSAAEKPPHIPETRGNF